MKIKCTLILLFFTLTYCSKSNNDPVNTPDVEPAPTEKIHYGDLIINSQGELDNFGAEKYDKIKGGVFLQGLSINNTSGLSTVKFIDGDISVLETNVENLDGFSNASIPEGKFVFVIGNPNLTQLNGLKSISGVLTNLNIYNNPLVNNIDGLKNISGVTNELTISDTKHLNNLNGLSGLNQPLNRVIISKNSELTDTNGLSNIPSIESFYFTRNEAITSLNGLSNLVSIGICYIDDNTNLENIDGLAQLTNCGSLNIRYNSALLNLDGLAKLNANGDGTLNIYENSALADLCGLSLLASSAKYYFNISYNFYNPTKEDIINGNCSM